MKQMFRVCLLVIWYSSPSQRYKITSFSFASQIDGIKRSRAMQGSQETCPSRWWDCSSPGCESLWNHWSMRLLGTSRKSWRYWRGDKSRSDAYSLPHSAPLGLVQQSCLDSVYTCLPKTDIILAAAIPHPSLVISHFSCVQNHLAIGLTSYIVWILRQTQLITRARKLVPDVN